jgi:hypothetical protein
MSLSNSIWKGGNGSGTRNTIYKLVKWYELLTPHKQTSFHDQIN